MTIPASLERKQAARLRVLKAIYDMTDGQTNAYASEAELYEHAGLASDEGSMAVDYLVHEDLLSRMSVDDIGITHFGVREVEAALADNGAAGTEHFSPGAITLVQNFHAPVGSVQTGGQGNTANVSQTVGVHSGDVVKLAEQLLERTREHGDADAIAAADRAHEHARAGQLEKVRFHVAALNTIAALAPLANAVLSAIANIGA